MEIHTMVFKSILFAACALLLSQVAARAQPVNKMPVGTEFENKIQFTRSEVPLPPGIWTLIATGETFSSGAASRMRSVLPFAHLAQIRQGKLVALVSMSGTLQADQKNWLREAECERTDRLFQIADTNLNLRDQWCFDVTHFVRTWVYNDKASDREKALYNYLRDAKIARPATTLVAESWIAQYSEFLQVRYEIDPEAFGGPAAKNRTWSTSEWHPQNIANFARHRAFADQWIEWSKLMLDAVRNGYNSTLANYTPAPVPVAGFAAAGIKLAPAGTKFELASGGGFEIVAVDGMNIRTVNGAKRVADWQAGGLLPTGAGARIDRPTADSLFPLAVGKKASFEHHETGEPTGWRQTLAVTGMDTLNVDGKAYSTFVVEGRTESLDPSKNPFVRKRTVWFAPEVGWLLKMHEEQIAGAPARMSSWQVVRILPPKN